MTKVAKPAVTVNINSAQLSVTNQPQKILFVGQQLASGSATDKTLQTNIQPGDEVGLYGQNSIIAQMIREARKVNAVTQFDGIPLDDAGAAVDATGTMAVTGTATEGGTLTLILGSESNAKVEVSVSTGDTATVVGDAIAAAINGLDDILVSAANVTGTVTITALNGGTIGNSIGLSVTGAANIAGIAIILTGMSSGATDPVLTNVLDVIGDTRYQAIVWAFPLAPTEVITFLDARFNTVNDVLDGVAFSASVDTFSNIQSAAAALNSQSYTTFGFKKITEAEYVGPSLIEPPIMVAAQFAGIRSFRLTDGESISSVVISNRGALDSVGGAALASKPYFNTPMNEFFIEAQGRGWSKNEQGSLETAGVAVVGNNSSATEVIVSTVPTTYKTDTGGNPDESFKFLNFVDTASGAREFIVNNLKSRFAQSRLTNGDLVAGRDAANTALLRATLIEFYNTLSGPQFVLTQNGEAARQFFSDNLTVSIDLTAGSATMTMNTPLVTQLREIIATMTIVFSPEG